MDIVWIPMDARVVVKAVPDLPVLPVQTANAEWLSTVQLVILLEPLEVVVLNMGTFTCLTYSSFPTY
jgi:hypothetical protein